MWFLGRIAKNKEEFKMYLTVGTVGLVGLIFYAAITGGGLGPFLDLPSFAIVVGGAFFATLAMSRGKFNQETVSFSSNASLVTLSGACRTTSIATMPPIDSPARANRGGDTSNTWCARPVTVF